MIEFLGLVVGVFTEDSLHPLEQVCNHIKRYNLLGANLKNCSVVIDKFIYATIKDIHIENDTFFVLFELYNDNYVVSCPSVNA